MQCKQLTAISCSQHTQHMDKTANVTCGRECGHSPSPPQKYLLSLAAAAPAKRLCQAAAVRGGMSHAQLEGKKSPSGPHCC